MHSIVEINHCLAHKLGELMELSGQGLITNSTDGFYIITKEEELITTMNTNQHWPQPLDEQYQCRSILFQLSTIAGHIIHKVYIAGVLADEEIDHQS